MICASMLALALAAAGTPALAGDKTDPRCSQYGPGFIYAESSGFCVRLSGQIEAGYSFGSGQKRNFGGSSNAFGTEATVGFDARKDTDLGPLRLYVAPKGGNLN